MIIVKNNARVCCATIRNWADDAYHLVSKRASCSEGATMKWIDGNNGIKVTVTFPAVVVLGEHAKGEALSVAFAGEGQQQDGGGKMVHTRTPARPHLRVDDSRHWPGFIPWSGPDPGGGLRVIRNVRRDARLVEAVSLSDTYAHVGVREDDGSPGHRPQDR